MADATAELPKAGAQVLIVDLPNHLLSHTLAMLSAAMLARVACCCRELCYVAAPAAAAERARQLGVALPSLHRGESAVMALVFVERAAAGGRATIASGTSHSLVSFPGSRLLAFNCRLPLPPAWGSTAMLGLGDGLAHDALVLTPTPIAAFDGAHLLGVAAGRSHSLALDEAGHVWSWGRRFNLLGQGVESAPAEGGSDPSRQMLSSPHRLGSLSAVRVVQIACGLRHSLCLSLSAVYSWGECGRALGHGIRTSAPSGPGQAPCEVRGLRGLGVLHLSAGPDCSLALTRAGELMGWGDNCWGQLGTGDTVSRPSPTRVDFHSSVRLVHASIGSHALALTSDGQLYGWGRNQVGQLCLCKSGTQLIPTMAPPVQLEPGGPALVLKRVMADCGLPRTALLTACGRIFLCGQWAHPNAGIPMYFRPRLLRPTNQIRLVELAIGQNSTLARGADGQVYVIGHEGERCDDQACGGAGDLRPGFKSISLDDEADDGGSEL
jgi:alpha-tubulin suppressor-like RCC1 family protein